MNQSPKIYSPIDATKITRRNSTLYINDEISFNTKNKINEEDAIKSKQTNENIMMLVKAKKKRKKKIKMK